MSQASIAVTASGSQSEAASPAEDVLPTSLKVSWGAGAFGASLLMGGIGGLAVYYLTKIVGLPSWVAGALLSVARIYDAFLDPCLGYISDRTTDRFGGRRRPYLLAGAVMSALAMFAAFNVPFRGDGFETIAYVLLVLLFFGTAYSTFNVPYIAMPAEMTDGYHERSSTHAWRVAFAGLGQATSTAGAGLLLGALSQGRRVGGVQVNTAGDYTVMSVIFGGLILLSMLTTWYGTRRARNTVRDARMPPWRTQLSTFLQNKPFLIIIAVKALQLVSFYAYQTALFFMIVEVLKRNSADVALVGLPSVAVSIVVSPLLLKLSRRIGKRGGYALAALFAMAGYVSWVGATPGEAPWLLMLRGGMNGVGFAGNVMFAMSMVTDAIELDSLRSGMRREGTYTAVYSFVEKFSGAIGPTIVGVALSWAGFDAKAAVTPETYATIRNATLLGVAYMPGLFTLISLGVLWLYDLDQTALGAMRAAAGRSK